MSKFLLIETSTEACSVALSEDDVVIASKDVKEFKAHARLLAPFIKEILEEKNVLLKDCSAISVSEGPGSYTGLRVGASTAKGLCFGADIPLIGVSTLDILAEMAVPYLKGDSTLIIPMIDAKRMEVYCSTYDSSCRRLSAIEAKVLDGTSFEEEFEKYETVIFIGDGAAKFKSCLNDFNLAKSVFVECCPSASYMAVPTLSAWNKKEFEDCAYFEPFYLKEFVAGTSKKSLI